MAEYRDFSVPGQGTVLQFREYKGKTTKPPVVLIHGLTGNLEFMHPLANALRKTGRTIFSYDLRGRGKSGRPESPYGVEAHAQDLISAMKHLGINQLALVCHSLGTWVALELTQLAPELLEKVVLLDGGASLPISQKLKNLRMVKTSLQRLDKEFPSVEDYFSEIAGSPFFTTWKKEWEACFLYELRQTPRNTWQCNLPKFVIEEELNSLGASTTTLGLLKILSLRFPYWLSRIRKSRILPYEKLNCPTLVVRAMRPNVSQNDQMIPDKAWEEMKGRLPQARFLQLHFSNHYSLVLDPPNELLREMSLFL